MQMVAKRCRRSWWVSFSMPTVSELLAIDSRMSPSRTIGSVAAAPTRFVSSRCSKSAQLGRMGMWRLSQFLVPVIRPFLDSLKEEPRALKRICALGSADPVKQFEVCVFAPERFIGSGLARREYWTDFEASTLENSVVFFDPDNGYETKMQRGSKWIRHDELKALFARLPETSVAVVYQHRPRRQWTDLFADLTQNLGYVHTAVAVYESNLAFVAMAGTGRAGNQIATILKKYADAHPAVSFTSLFCDDNAA
jgi:hypothetical protein